MNHYVRGRGDLALLVRPLKNTNFLCVSVRRTEICLFIMDRFKKKKICVIFAVAKLDIYKKYFFCPNSGTQKNMSHGIREVMII